MRSRPRYRPNTHRSITRIPCPVLEGHARIVTPGSVLNAFFGWGVLSRTEVSVGKVALRLDETREFRMGAESASGSSFFQTGKATTRQLVSEPQLVDDRFHVREELGSRVVPDQPGRRGFFYREWTIWSGPWKALQDPKVHCVETEVIYSAATAWRPWMKMGDGPGHTVQNGRGGKVERVEDLPPELLRLTRQVHPDLVRDPAGVLAANRG